MRPDGPIVAVVGAINVDLVVSGAPLPGPGETVTGGTFAQHHGGKGGNQATAAARATQGNAAPAGVWVLGAVGDDPLGIAALAALRNVGVHTDHVLVTPDAPTGVALIEVDGAGENQISVAPGANGSLEPDQVVAALESLNPAVLLASLEVPEATARAAMRWCRDRAVTVILNPAPAQPWVADLVSSATFITPNEHERTSLGAVPDDVLVIETRGADGAVIHHHDGSDEHIPGPMVPVVDTTGAGDCFNGVFAAELARGTSLADAVRSAVVAAALSVGAAGARDGMPDAAAIQEARERFGR